ncbi:hypothetical protein [Gemmobacter sp.]|uniref:hypothetical protein n=1 Tax=Gemmobacter sp. TaxID=1898957 RepID=UPI00391CFD11
MPEALELSLEAWCATDRMPVSPAGDLRGGVDDRLEAMRRRRRAGGRDDGAPRTLWLRTRIADSLRG